jgi:hypothetical protein
VLSICFLGLSVIILYAEIAHVIGIQNNIIYNIVTVPTTTSDTMSFIGSTVSPLISHFLLDRLPDPSPLPCLRY